MKKILCAGIVLFTLLSCSNDDPQDSTGLNVNGTLLKKMVVTENDVATFWTDFTYNGNRLLSTKNADGQRYTYTYTGNLITKIESFDDDIQWGTQIFEYDANDRLVVNKRINTNSGTGYKVTYDYNEDGSIVNVAAYTGDAVEQNDLVKTKIAYVTDGQVTKLEEFHEGSLVSTVSYTYDDKNYPYNSILGYNKLLSYDIGVSGNHNNVVQYEFTDAEGNTNTDTFSNTYNIFGYTITSYPPISLNQAVTHYFYQ